MDSAERANATVAFGHRPGWTRLARLTRSVAVGILITVNLWGAERRLFLGGLADAFDSRTLFIDRLVTWWGEVFPVGA